MAFEFKWQFSFSDGEKEVTRGDSVKSQEDTTSVDFVRLISKSFTDTLQGVVGNRKDLKRWIFDEGVIIKKPFVVFPKEEVVVPVKKEVKTTKKVK